MDGIKTRVSGRDREDQRDRGGCSESPVITSEAVYEYTLWPFCFSSLLSSLAFLILHYFLVRRRHFELIQPICFPLSPVLSRFLLFIGALIQSLSRFGLSRGVRHLFWRQGKRAIFLPILTIASHIYIFFLLFLAFFLISILRSSSLLYSVPYRFLPGLWNYRDPSKESLAFTLSQTFGRQSIFASICFSLS